MKQPTLERQILLDFIAEVDEADVRAVTQAIAQHIADHNPEGAARVLRKWGVLVGLPAQDIPPAPAQATSAYNLTLTGERVPSEPVGPDGDGGECVA
jgi:hypothetical protein